ncbi:histidine phosphatase family protein [Patescibacteria group bacterium]|nr:histidine phosphatase family protein [Patescibacteria group bacterium]MBU2035919.1 histidine phosphatase family protein [Patescibacteria group bacterium]
MLVYLVRHGESEGNKKGFHQSPVVTLTKEGIKQAKSLANRLTNLKIDFIYSSPQVRAKQTSQIISKKLGVPIEFWENLKEIKKPSEIWGKPVDDDLAMKIKKLAREDFIKGNKKYSDEETFEELNQRGKNVLDYLLKDHKDQNILCISHSAMIKMIVGKIIFGKNLTPSEYLNLREHTWLINTGITVCEHTNKWGWTLISWNDTTHL